MPTVWNASPYDLYPGDGTATILANTTVTVLASDYVTAAILAGLLVIADGNHTATTGLGNPAQTQTAPILAQLPPTASDGKSLPGGSELPVDATAADRTVILSKARVGVVCGYSKVDNSAHHVAPDPHETDTVIPAALATLSTPQSAVRLFGYTGGWVAVPYNPDAVTGAALFTQMATMNAGQTVLGGSLISDGQHVSGGQTISGGHTVTGGSTTDALTVNGATTATGLITATKGATISGGVTADTVTATGLVTATKGTKITGGLTTDTINVSGVSTLNGAIDMGTNPIYAGHGYFTAIDASGAIGTTGAGTFAGLTLNGQLNMGTFAVYCGHIAATDIQTSAGITTGVITCGQINAGANNIYAGHGYFQALDSQNGIGTPANVQCGTLGTGVITSGQHNMGTSNIYCGTVYAQAVVTPSSVEAKRRIVDVAEDDLDTLLAAPVKEWERLPSPDYSPEQASPRQVSAMADDLPAVLHRQVEEDDRTHVDHQSYIGLLHGLVQRQQRQIDELTARLDRVEAAAAA